MGASPSAWARFMARTYQALQWAALLSLAGYSMAGLVDRGAYACSEESHLMLHFGHDKLPLHSMQSRGMKGWAARLRKTNTTFYTMFQLLAHEYVEKGMISQLGGWKDLFTIMHEIALIDENFLLTYCQPVLALALLLRSVNDLGDVWTRVIVAEQCSEDSRRMATSALSAKDAEWERVGSIYHDVLEVLDDTGEHRHLSATLNSLDRARLRELRRLRHACEFGCAKTPSTARQCGRHVDVVFPALSPSAADRPEDGLAVSHKASDTQSLMPGVMVCIRGLTGLSKKHASPIHGSGQFVASGFWHFMRGHFFETMLLLHAAGLLPPQLHSLGPPDQSSKTVRSLAFGHPEFVCPPRESLLSFYDLLLPDGVRVMYDPNCETTASLYRSDVPAMILEFQEMFMEYGRSDTFDWPGYLQSCRAAPGVGRALALSRLQRPGEEASDRQVTLIVRKHTRDVLNPRDIAAVFRQSAEVSSHAFQQVVLEDLSWQEQLRVVLRSGAILAYCGAVAAHEVWMPSGAVLVSFEFRTAWFCKQAYCAASHPLRDFLFVLSTPASSGNAFGSAGWNLSFGTFRAFETKLGMASAAAETGSERGSLLFYGPSPAKYAEGHVLGREVGTRAAQAVAAAWARSTRSGSTLAAAFRGWLASEDPDSVVLDACAGAAVQVFE